jgi:pilus assembly protein Flp/PilA
MSLIKHFLNDKSGATAIEYSLIAALIAAAIITALQTMGTDLKGAFTNIGNTIKSAGN